MLDRYIPEGSTLIRSKLAPAVIYTYERNGKALAIGYAGKAKRPTFHHQFRNEAARAKFCAQWLESQAKAQEWRNKREAERRERLAKPHGIKVGDVFSATWGYDQTNIDYYEVTELVGKRTAVLRKIASRAETDSFMSGSCVPAPGHYIGKPMRRRIDEYGSVAITSFIRASKIEPTAEVAGVKMFSPDRWSSYA